jgi:hypothetical protein
LFPWFAPYPELAGKLATGPPHLQLQPQLQVLHSIIATPKPTEEHKAASCRGKTGVMENLAWNSFEKGRLNLAIFYSGIGAFCEKALGR